MTLAALPPGRRCADLPMASRAWSMLARLAESMVLQPPGSPSKADSSSAETFTTMSVTGSPRPIAIAAGRFAGERGEAGCERCLFEALRGE